MPFRLVYEDEATDIVGTVAVLGRSRTCDLQLLHTEVSREHARITCDGDQATIEDLDSANGVLVNGEPIQRHRRLAHNDVITIVEMVVRFEWPGRNDDPSGDSGSRPVVTPSVVRRRSYQGAADQDAFRTSMQSRFEVLCEAATAEISSGDVAAATETIKPALHRVLERAYRGAVERETIVLAARFALKLARPGAQIDWADYVLQLCIASRRPLPRNLGTLWVDTVGDGSKPEHLAAYSAMLREMVGARDGDAQAALQLLECSFPARQAAEGLIDPLGD